MKRIILFLLLAASACGATYDYPVKTPMNPPTANRAVTTDANGKIVVSTVTTNELGYVSGVTSAIQTQLDAKGAATNGTFFYPNISWGVIGGATNSAAVLNGTTTGNGVLTLTPTNLTETALIITTMSGQTNYLQSWNTNSGVRAAVKHNGVFTGQGYSFLGNVYPATDMTISRSSSDLYFEGISGGFLYFRPNGTGNNSGLVRMNSAYSSFAANVAVGGTITPQYALDVNGTARIIGTNGFNFGGTSGAADHTATVHQPTASALAVSIAGAEKTRVNATGLGVGMTPATTLDVSGTVRATAQVAPTSGSGIELTYTGGVGYLRGYNRDGGLYVPVGIEGLRTYINGTSGGNLLIGGTVGSNINYKIDVNGTGRFIGTNGVNFGGTLGGSDHTATINQSSANTLSITATTTTVSGGLTIAGTTILTQSSPPASAAAAGTVGTIAWDANYIYICTAANTWKRVAIATW